MSAVFWDAALFALSVTMPSVLLLVFWALPYNGYLPVPGAS